MERTVERSVGRSTEERSIEERTTQRATAAYKGPTAPSTIATDEVYEGSVVYVFAVVVMWRVWFMYGKMGCFLIPAHREIW
jgi:hypothetical protein